MIACAPRRVRTLLATGSRSTHRSRSLTPAIEGLEGRQLLSFYTGPALSRELVTKAGIYQVQIEGAGLFKVFPAGGGALDLKLFGTTNQSTLSISLVRPLYHHPAQPFQIRKLTVVSGQLGTINAPAAVLTGKASPLSESVNSITLEGLGPRSQMSINGGLGSLSIGSVDLGPTGSFVVSEDLLNGEQTTSITIGTMTLDGGRFAIGPDSLGPIQINGDLNLTHDGVLAVTRDLSGGLSVGGNLNLANGGQIAIGRNLSSLSVTGNVYVNQSSDGIAVGGSLGALLTTGYFVGQGGTTNPSAIDVGVGLAIGSIIINGGLPGVGGLIKTNIVAGGPIGSTSVPYGIVQSTITPNTPPA